MEIRKGKKHINEECVNMMNIKKEKKLDIEEKNTQEESSNRCKPCESESNDMKYHELRLNGQNAECCVSLKICSFFLTFIVSLTFPENTYSKMLPC